MLPETEFVDNVGSSKTLSLLSTRGEGSFTQKTIGIIEGYTQRIDQTFLAICLFLVILIRIPKNTFCKGNGAFD